MVFLFPFIRTKWEARPSGAQRWIRKMFESRPKQEKNNLSSLNFYPLYAAARNDDAMTMGTLPSSISILWTSTRTRLW